MQNLMKWVLRITAALIMLQTLFFKFTAAPESVKLFTILGMEPWGRWGTGIAELIAAILLIIPATSFFGAVMGLGLMAGAIFFHLTRLGIYFGGDALLFCYALIVFFCCAILAFWQRDSLFTLIRSRQRL